MTQELLDQIGLYYVNNKVSLENISNDFNIELSELEMYFRGSKRIRLSEHIQDLVNEKKKNEENFIKLLIYYIR